MLPVYFAPMEGLTDAVFRRVHHQCFPGVDSYYIPFISPTQNLVLTGREKHNVLPEYNAGVPCIPQVLTKDPDHFLWAAGILADMGYTEINLNAGCPSATVTTKGKGAGILRDRDALDHLLEEICRKSPLPVSVKTRIGFDSSEEWAELLKLYSRYPLKRLIVHPRTCRERYDPGTIHRECRQTAAENYPGELIFNGDLFYSSDIQALLQENRHVDGIMLGRGLVSQPALARELKGGAPLQKEELIRFHDRLEQELSELYRPDIVFMKLRIIMKHLACCFANTGKLEKQIRKSRKLPELLAVDRQLFDTCELKAVPGFMEE